ncbi:MAG: superoxide dismutase family protein [Tepidisphaeraceae bacterium]
MTTRRALLIVPTVSLALMTGCQDKEKHHDHDMHHADHHKMDAQAGATAVANIQPSGITTTRPVMGKPTGTVSFKQEKDGKVKVTAEISGLPSNTTHGFHIHEKGDLSAPDLSSAGAHYNPEGHPHAGVETHDRHAGDLGNITSDNEGNARYEQTVDNISVGGSRNNVVGKSVIVHAKPDDLKSQPSGNAGDRIGGGVIEMKK